MSPLDLSYVKELHIVLESDLIQMVHYPEPHEVCYLVEHGMFNTRLLQDRKLPKIQKLMTDTKTFTEATKLSIRFLATIAIPMVTTVKFVSVQDISKEARYWYGKLMASDPRVSLYMQRVKRLTPVTQLRSIKIEWQTTAPMLGTCRYCLAGWTPHHRIDDDELLFCPGLAGDLLTDENWLEVDPQWWVGIPANVSL